MDMIEMVPLVHSLMELRMNWMIMRCWIRRMTTSWYLWVDWWDLVRNMALLFMLQLMWRSWQDEVEGDFLWACNTWSESAGEEGWSITGPPKGIGSQASLWSMLCPDCWSSHKERCHSIWISINSNLANTQGKLIVSGGACQWFCLPTCNTARGRI